MAIKEVEKVPGILRASWGLGFLSLLTFLISVPLILSFILIVFGLPILGFSALLGLISLGMSAVALTNGIAPRKVASSIIMSIPSIIAGVIAFIFFFTLNK